MKINYLRLKKNNVSFLGMMILTFLFSFQVKGAFMPPTTDYYSIVEDGSWTDLLTWSSTSGGATCTCSPTYNSTTANDHIHIETNVVLTGNLSVSSNTTITITSGDTLTVNGDVVFSNGSVININAGGVLIINGNVTNNNNSNTITIDGEIIINGNFTGGNGSEINGAGSMDISGDVTTTGSGEVFGSQVDCSGPGCSSSAASPLPIELIYFNVIPNGKIIEITWTTVSEVNNDYFIIEKSKDGLEWEAVIESKGAGTSNSVIDYFEIDNDPYKGLSYYRLTQVDYNGKSETFNTIPVEFISTENGVMSVFPNPAKKGERINISFKDIACEGQQDILVLLRDLKGVEVYSKIELVDCEEGLVAIDRTHHLAAGTYLVIASSENLLYSQKILITE